MDKEKGVRMDTMAGRQAFLEILRAAGVEYILGNPGTIELPLMDILVNYRLSP